MLLRIWQSPRATSIAVALFCALVLTTSPGFAACPDFVTAGRITVGNSPDAVAVGDFNSDGKKDIAVLNEGDNTVSILLGNGNGTFGAPTNFPAGADPVAIVVGDFNNDGRMDLAIANNSAGTVTILLGNGVGAIGNGTFTPAAGSPIAVGSNPQSIAVGNFDAGSNLDLAVANSGSANVSILLGNGSGGFAVTTVAVGNGPRGVVVGLFDGT